MKLNEFDIDSLKQMVGGSSPYKLCLVYSVAILHLVFEWLAFSADFEFWRRKTSFEGMSSISLSLQCCMNVVMFLYVQEENKSKFIMYFVGFRLLLNLWKLRKLTTLQRTDRFPFVKWVSRSHMNG